MTHPPHLPSKSSSLQQRRAVQTLPWLFVFMALTAVIATAISTAFLAWYVPDFVSYYVPAAISNRQTVINENGIDPLLAKYIDERTVNIYRSIGDVDSTVLTAGNRIGQGIILSSDGWIAIMSEEPLPQGSIVLDTEGKTHTIASTVVDRITGITYAKVSEGNFLVSSLANWEQDVYGSTVLVMDLWGVHTTMPAERVVLQSPTRMSLHMPYSTVAVMEQNGSIVFDEAGAVIGFVVDGELVPSWYVSHALSAILASTPIEITRSGYQGVLVEAYTDPVNGVYVEASAIQIIAIPMGGEGMTDDTTLRVGDIITNIGSQSIDIHTFARMWSAPNTVSLRIIRDNEYRTIELSA